MKKTKIFITAQLTWASANSLVDDSGYEATLHCAACLYAHYRTSYLELEIQLLPTISVFQN